jgi:hypothetical protein
MKAGVGSLFWLRIERRNKKEDRRELYLSYKGILSVCNPKRDIHIGNSTEKTLVEKTEMTVEPGFCFCSFIFKNKHFAQSFKNKNNNFKF